MILKKCPECKKFSLKDKCAKCGCENISAHYKFKKVKDVKPSTESN